ncbi:MAG: rhodanese-like domain-containing protein [Christensenella sp.]|uniref:rhodanese-like domain-containing protein n=1 Tax=Christensenella sp. TaxID=1935934 RepID=UPI002B2126D9|nr:rhodanese-like domain-containing protein [Christensenella sp.]MEA5002278.1 rhodanese-like domain-containing protein [Christensenella sp.]
MITAQELKQKLDDNTNFLLVDVRTPGEYDEGHIPGAILLPVDIIDDGCTALLPDLAAEIVLYCRSGMRSKKALKKLSAIGYTNLTDLKGGIMDWPYEVGV